MFRNGSNDVVITFHNKRESEKFFNVSDKRAKELEELFDVDPNIATISVKKSRDRL